MEKKATKLAFEPVITVFTCNWCSHHPADVPGLRDLKYPAKIRLIRLACSGRLDPDFVLKAFATGADGVVVAGCHPASTHYREQKGKTMRRFVLMQQILRQMDIEPERLKLVWGSAVEDTQFATEINDLLDKVRRLGQLDWPPSQQMELLLQETLAQPYI
jgi:F420-non-reducing hydrogenase iron-sulfur subunit